MVFPFLLGSLENVLERNSNRKITLENVLKRISNFYGVFRMKIDFFQFSLTTKEIDFCEDI